MTNAPRQDKTQGERTASKAKQNPFAALRRDLEAGRDPVEAIRTGFDADMLTAAGDYFEVPAARIRAITRVPDTTAHRLIKRHASGLCRVRAAVAPGQRGSNGRGCF